MMVDAAIENGKAKPRRGTYSSPHKLVDVMFKRSKPEKWECEVVKAYFAKKKMPLDQLPKALAKALK
eukprot:SAG11_NODE_3890_length_2164_cov_6.150121_2_plen_67_part_00